MWLRTSNPWRGAKRSMRNGSCLLTLPQELPPRQGSPTLLFYLSLISAKLDRAAPCLPTLAQNQKLFMEDGVIVWDSLAEQNNLKIVWNYHWVVSICPYLSRYFLQAQTNYFFILDDSCTPHMCTSPTEYKLKTCKKQGKGPCDSVTGGKGSGWEDMASHHGKTSSSSMGPGRECGQGHRGSSGKSTTTNTRLMQPAEGTPALQSSISECVGTAGMYEPLHPKKPQRSTCMEFRKYEPWKGGKINEETVEKAREKTWHWIQHIARWMHLQTKPDSPLLSKNQESI